MSNKALRVISAWRKITGTADIDVSAADYTTVGGINILTIENPSSRQIIDDCWIVFDCAKTTTGLSAAGTTETNAFMVARKVDGTSYRAAVGPENATTATTCTNFAGGAAALRIGPIGATEDVRIHVVQSVEVAADVEIPYVIYYRGATPTVTPVAAA